MTKEQKITDFDELLDEMIKGIDVEEMIYQDSFEGMINPEGLAKSQAYSNGDQDFKKCYACLEILSQRIIKNSKDNINSMHDDVVLKLFDRVKTLIEDKGIDPNLSVRQGSSPMIVAAYAGNWQMMRFLHDKGVDVNYRFSVSGQNLLHSVVNSRNPVAVEAFFELIENDPNCDKDIIINHCDKSGTSPLGLIVHDKNLNATALSSILLRFPSKENLEKSKTQAHQMRNLGAVKDMMGFEQFIVGSDYPEEENAAFKIVKLQEICRLYGKKMRPEDFELMDSFVEKSADRLVKMTKDDPQKAETALLYLVNSISNIKSQESMVFISHGKEAADRCRQDFEDITRIGARLIIENGADITKKGQSKKTILHHVAYYNMVELMDELSQKDGFNLNVTCDEGKTPLHYACQNRSLDVIDKMLERDESLINKKDKYGNSVLHDAVKNRNFLLAAALIDKGADCNIANKDGKTPLHLAVSCDKSGKIVKKISQNMSEKALNSLDKQGDSALHLAVKHNNKDAFVSLGQVGCDHNVLDSKRNIASVYAEVNSEIYNIIFPPPTREDKIEELGRSMLNLQVQVQAKKGVGGVMNQDFKKILSDLALLGLDVNYKSSEGLSLVHMAARSGQMGIFNDVMSRNNADVNLKTDAGVSVLQYAIQSKNGDIIHRVLESCDVDVKVLNRGLELAIELRDSQVVRAILNNDKVSGAFSGVNEKGKKLFDEDKFKGMANKISGPSKNSIKLEINKFSQERNQVHNTVATAEVEDISAEEKAPKKSKNARKREKKLANQEKRKEEEEQEKIREARRLQIEEQRAQEEVQRRAILEAQEEARQEAMRIKEEKLVAIEQEAKDNFEKVKGSLAQKINLISGIEMGDVDIDGYTTKETSSEEEYEDWKDDFYSSASEDSEEKDSNNENDNKEEVSTKTLLSANAKEFVPIAKSHSKQMQEFFQKDRRQIESIADLPEFLQEVISNLVNCGYKVLLKGSAVNRNVNYTSRLPADLDIEIVGNGFINGKDKSAKSFFKNFFDLTLENEDIYRGPKKNRQDFTAHMVDEERFLDISLYDVKSPSRRSWLDSVEKKILFEPGHDGSISMRRVSPLGYSDFLRHNPDLEVKKGDILFNTEALSLILITTFRKTVNGDYDGKYDVINAIKPNPASALLIRELKMTSEEFTQAKEEDQEVMVKNKLKKFIDAHEMDEQLQVDFLSNLLDVVMDKRNVQNITSGVYSNMIKDAIGGMRDQLLEERKEPSAIASVSNIVSQPGKSNGLEIR